MSEPPLRFPAARLGCSLVRGDLPDRLIEWGPLPEVMENHLATCLACQADAGPNRLVGEAVSELADAPLATASPGLDERVMDGLGQPTATELRRRRAAIGWSAGALVTAAATAMILAMRRSRAVGAH